MIYLKIDDRKYPIEKFSTFTSQFGNDAIRIIGETPIATNGFQIVDEEDNVISDRSEYVYLLREDSSCKEYTRVVETIMPTKSFSTEVKSTNPIQQQINSLNKRVNDITPYTESKTAYIDDTEVSFNIVKDGNVSVYMVDSDGQNVSFEFERINEQIKVMFDKRESLATVTISIQ